MSKLEDMAARLREANPENRPMSLEFMAEQSLLGGNYSLRRETFPTRALAARAMQDIRLDQEDDKPLAFVATQARADLPKAPVEGVEVFYAFDTAGQA